MSFNSIKKEWHATKNPTKLQSIDENHSLSVKRGRSLCFPEETEYISTKIAIDPQSEQAIYQATTEAHTLRRFKSDKVRPATTFNAPSTLPLFGLGRSYTTVDRNKNSLMKINRRNTISPDKSSQKLEENKTTSKINAVNLIDKDAVSLLDNNLSVSESSIDNRDCANKRNSVRNSTLCETSPSVREYKTTSYYYSSSSEASPRNSLDSPTPATALTYNYRYSSGGSETTNYKSSSDETQTASTDSHYSSMYRSHSNKLLQQYGNQCYTSLQPRISSSISEVDGNGRPTFFSFNSTPFTDDLKDKISIITAESYLMKIKRPYFTILTTVVMVAYFITTMVINYRLSGHPIQLSPFNVMVGPNKQTLIYTGARYIPCIKPTLNYPADKDIYVCPYTKENGQLSKPIYNDQTPFNSRFPFSSNMNSTGDNNCNLQSVCGGPSFADPNTPDQGYRFLSTSFMHSGVLQLLINLSLHIMLGISIEARINFIRYGTIWLSSGVFGYIFSSNFVPEGNVSVGCSVSLMGVLAFILIDIIKNWNTIRRPKAALLQFLLCFVVSLAIGLLPGYDNFAHLGGFIGGLLGTLVVLPMASATPLPLIQNTSHQSKLNGPVVHFWLMRVIAFSFLVILTWIMLYMFLFHGGYQQTCQYCQYISCIPISDICSPYT